MNLVHSKCSNNAGQNVLITSCKQRRKHHFGRFLEKGDPDVSPLGGLSSCSWTPGRVPPVTKRVLCSVPVKLMFRRSAVVVALLVVSALGGSGARNWSDCSEDDSGAIETEARPLRREVGRTLGDCRMCGQS